MQVSKVQLAPLTNNAIMAVVSPKLVIQLIAFRAFEAGKKLNSVHFPITHYFCSSKKEVFHSLPSNNGHTMHIFIVFMGTNQDQIFDDDIDYECYVKNLMRSLNSNIAREWIDKRFKEFCNIGLLKILII